MKDECSACGVKWEDHLGIEGTCEHLQVCLRALKVVHTWASFDIEYEHQFKKTLVPEHVVNLTRKALQECNVPMS